MDTLTGLVEIIREITGRSVASIVPTARFVDDLDVDSLSMVEVAVAAEERFGVRIPDEALASLKTVGDAVAYIEAQQSVSLKGLSVSAEAQTEAKLKGVTTSIAGLTSFSSG